MMRSRLKIKTISELVHIVRKLKRSGKRIVSTNGCFDIIHPGHVSNLEWAKAKGDVLIVGINSDASIRALKGSKRPIVSARDRARVLAGLEAVDYVFVFGGLSPIPWIVRIEPDLHVKGYASVHSPAFPPEERAVKEHGGKVILAPQIGGRSTTGIIERILRKHSGKSR